MGLIFHVLTSATNIRRSNVDLFFFLAGLMTYRLRRENGCLAIYRIRLTTVDFGG